MTCKTHSNWPCIVNTLKAELQKLYSDASKHSVYQNVPDFVSTELGYTETIDETWRSDRPRLAYLRSHRIPKAGERWVDFGANTGFFTLSLAKQYPEALFTAVEANANHAQFIERVARYFGMKNVEVIQRAIGLEDLGKLPESDFLLHLNVLHHAGHDFDVSLVPRKEAFPEYAKRYLTLLRERTGGMLFQMGSNWGGDKRQPLIGVREDLAKLETFAGWLRNAGWHLLATAYPRQSNEASIHYEDFPNILSDAIDQGDQLGAVGQATIDALNLDNFPGEFHRRPLLLCRD